MRYISTRGAQGSGLVDAVMRGLAADGGLYVPDDMPRLDPHAVRGDSLAEIAAEVLAPFFEGSGLESELGAICRDAFDFPLPLKELAPNGELAVLELFHGPTAAFKDVGARFLASLMERALRRSSDARPLTILVATSGDTGGAVAAAFHRRRGIRVGVLFPKGQVSPRQQHQLTCWGDNVRAFEVDGTFDACQALVKAAFTDPGLQRRHRLTAANSINIGRLLPQVAYHAAASLWHWRRHGTAAGSIVPSGNLGNGMACVWARAMGLPVRELVLAVNANRTIPDYLATGQWQPRPSVATLASAIDVRNGRRQSEQHGTAAQPTARIRVAAHERRGLSCRRREHPHADREGLRSLRRGLVPAYGDGVLGLRSPSASAQVGPGVDRQRDG